MTRRRDRDTFCSERRARALLNGFGDDASGEWGPGEKGDGPLSDGALYWFWIKARAMSGIVANAPLRHLRHSHASHAVMKGDSLHVTGHLLGHRRVSTTNRYGHLDDATLSRAAERVAFRLLEQLGLR